VLFVQTRPSSQASPLSRGLRLVQVEQKKLELIINNYRIVSKSFADDIFSSIFNFKSETKTSSTSFHLSNFLLKKLQTSIKEDFFGSQGKKMNIFMSFCAGCMFNNHILTKQQASEKGGKKISSLILKGFRLILI